MYEPWGPVNVAEFSEVFFENGVDWKIVKKVFAGHVLIDYISLCLQSFPVYVIVGFNVPTLRAPSGFCFVVKLKFIILFIAMNAPVTAISPNIKRPLIKRYIILFRCGVAHFYNLPLVSTLTLICLLSANPSRLRRLIDWITVMCTLVLHLEHADAWNIFMISPKPNSHWKLKRTTNLLNRPFKILASMQFGVQINETMPNPKT